MQILIAIDDTDNLEKGRGTGQLAEELAVMIAEKGWGNSERITRHQLLIHEDIPYTSHNSSMCFRAEIRDLYFKELIDFASEFLEREHASESDPGLCVADISKVVDPDSLIAFGWSAKKIILTKEQAYETAKKTGVHLSEHGGTGLGVIGALAGAALRLSGNDGEFKGNANIAEENSILTVAEICETGKADFVMSLDGSYPDENELVKFGRFQKTILSEGKSVLLVAPAEGSESKAGWKACSKAQVREFGDARIV